jgi:hypothetical protein
LVFLAPESEQSSPPITARQTFFCNRGFPVGEDGDAFLILVYLIALVLEVENCSASWRNDKC